MSDEEIVAEYVRLRDSMEVAFKAGVCTQTVLAAVRRQGLGDLIPKRGRQTVGKFRNLELPGEEVARRYLAGASGPQIALAAGCTASTIYNLLRRQGVEVRPSASCAARPPRRGPRRHQEKDAARGQGEL